MASAISAAIVAELAERYTAPPAVIEKDVVAMLADLKAKEGARNMNAHAPPPPAPPIGLLVELTHRCPLGCPYCSNPLALERPGAELDAETWKRVFSEAAALGALHVHLSGGEPTARRDIAEIVRGAAQAGLYTNLITSGVGVEREALERHSSRRASIMRSSRSRAPTRRPTTASATIVAHGSASAPSPRW